MALPSFEPDFAAPGDWAAMYRAAGLQVVPANMPRHDKEWKFPALTTWKTFQQELVPDSKFDEWYGPKGGYIRQPNMGMLTGLCSGNALVIDLDEYKNVGALQWWSGLLEVHNNGIEPETPQQITGGGGRQLVFLAPSTWRGPVSTTPIGVDIRGQGGFAMLPPSQHISGRPYAWKPGCAPWEIEFALAPDWLLQAVDALVEKYGGDPRESPGPTASTPNPEEEFDAFGNRKDGRDKYMRNLIWAALINWRQECPIPPTDAESSAHMKEVYAVYERKTKSRLPAIDGASNADLLEREGRGHTLFIEKWRRAISKWSTDIAEASKHPLECDEWKEATAPPPPIAETEDDESEPIDVSTLTGEPKPREWLAQDWIPLETVSNISGDGGMGKTLLAQQLQYSTSLGYPWLGIETKQVSSLGVYCEDDANEMHRRHNAIKKDLGHSIGNPLMDCWIWPRVGHDNLLVTFDKDNRPTMSAFFHKVMKNVLDKKIGLLVLDTIADLFGGNEIIRAQVNFFIKATCGAFIKRARDADQSLTVVLLSHPSQAGRNSGTGESGSTAWNNAVRSRLYLTRPEDGLPEQRTLTRKKSNYSSSGDEVKLDLLWKDGALKVAGSDNTVTVHSVENQIKDLVSKAWDEGRPYNAKRGDGMRFLDGEMVLSFRDRVPVEAIIQAIKNLKMTGTIEVQKTKTARGFNVKR